MLVFVESTINQILLDLVTPPLTLRLFVNDIVPDISLLESQLIEPAPISGYSPISIDPDLWKLNSDDKISIEYPPKVFLFSGHVGDIFGYWIAQKDGSILAAERLSNAPQVIEQAGDFIVIKIVLEWRS